MSSQTFTLRLSLPPAITSDEAIELLGAAGCTDLLVGAGEPGILAVRYSSPVALSAIGDVARLFPEAVVLDFGPDGESGSPRNRASP